MKENQFNNQMRLMASIYGLDLLLIEHVILAQKLTILKPQFGEN